MKYHDGLFRVTAFIQLHTIPADKFERLDFRIVYVRQSFQMPFLDDFLPFFGRNHLIHRHNPVEIKVGLVVRGHFFLGQCRCVDGFEHGFRLLIPSQQHLDYRALEFHMKNLRRVFACQRIHSVEVGQCRVCLPVFEQLEQLVGTFPFYGIRNSFIHNVMQAVRLVLKLRVISVLFSDDTVQFLELFVQFRGTASHYHRQQDQYRKDA